ncbi:MAG: PucR family transcriptional regulator ligand-binding domain-containing protein, partial [Oscillospiraceae bacterium]
MLTVNDVLGLSVFKGAVVVAGKKGLQRVVENMSVMEVPDIEDYIKKGDFLLTTLFPVYKEQNKLENLIIKLDMAGLSGIGIKLNRYVDELPDYFYAQAEELDFPIVILSADSNLSDLINIFLKDSLEKKNKELEYRNNIHNQLLEIILKGQEHRVLADRLSDTLGRSITLLNSDFELLAKSRAPSDTLPETTSLKEYILACKENSFAAVNLGSHFGFIYLVHYGTERAGYILISDDTQFEMSPMDKIAVEQFSIVFRIIVQKQRTIVELEHQYVTEFTCDLLYGKIDSAPTAISRARAFRWNLAFPQSVCLIDVQSSHHASNRITLTEQIQNEMYGRYTDSRRWNVFSANTGRYIVLFLDEVAAGDYKRVFEVLGKLFETLNIRHYHVSVSRPAGTLEELTRAYSDAQRTIEIALMVGEKKMLHFKETGVYRVIQSNENKEELWEYCNDCLG